MFVGVGTSILDEIVLNRFSSIRSRMSVGWFSWHRLLDAYILFPMNKRRRYRRSDYPNHFVTAVQLRLDTQGFVYQKWGARQRCKRGDWLVDNCGDIYTVDANVFEKTYRQLSPGVFTKDSPVYAKQATCDGRVMTLEGVSEYHAGDYIVSNNADGSDAYSISAEKFEAMYKTDE